MGRGRYAAAFFDVGNTLVLPYPPVSQICERILRAAGHGRDPEAIESLMPVIDAYYEERFQSDDTFWSSEEATLEVWVGMYALLCRRLGIDDDAEVLARAVYDEFGSAELWRLYDDVVPAFERLREEGIRVGVISNWDSRLESVLDGLGLTPYLDTVVCSAAVGLHKPDPRIFDLACARLDVLPEHCVHIGDHFYSDIVGARSAGLAAVLIKRHGAPGTVPVASIRTLAELGEVL